MKDSLDERFTLRDYEAPDKSAEVEVSERQYRACALDFVHNNDVVGFSIWASKIQIFIRDGWAGPWSRDVTLSTLVKALLDMGKTDEEFEDMLVHFLQTRAALQQAIDILDKAITKRVSRMDDGTEIGKGETHSDH